MKILVLNCGSSSIKYQLLEVDGQQQILVAKGLVERIGLPQGRLVHRPVAKDNFEHLQPIPTHTVGISLILDALVNPEHGVIESLSEIQAAGHRVAHGGEFFSDSAVIDQEVKRQIEACVELAPLHNPAALKGITSIEAILPQLTQVAVFDTSFHSTMPSENYVYALPYEYYEEKRIRRYGFHGTSHKYVAQKACAMAGLDFCSAKVITCHIGNGASVTAIHNGQSVNTSMGFTPVDGLLMGSRCGEIDPGVLLYIMEQEGMTPERANDLINKESGMLGLTGVSTDMRDVKAAAEDGNRRAQLTLRMFTGRLRRFIGAYFAELGGCDLVVFTGGIGENEPFVRRDATVGLDAMGISLDPAANDATEGVDAVVSATGSKVKVVVATTNEELVIAMDTFRLVSQ